MKGKLDLHQALIEQNMRELEHKGIDKRDAELKKSEDERMRLLAERVFGIKLKKTP